MSHVVTMGLEITDLEALDEACKELGLELVRGQETFKWYETWVGDYNQRDAAYRNGIDPKEYGKCSHAIRIPGSELDTTSHHKMGYEIGLKANTNNGFDVIWDNWQGGMGLSTHIGIDGEKLRIAYAKNKAMNIAKSQMDVSRFETEVTEDGRTLLYLYDYNT